MENAQGALKGFFVRLTSSEILAELLAIVIAGLIALAATYLMRSWARRRPGLAEQAGLQARLFEALVLLAPFLFAITLLVFARGLLAGFAMDTAVIDIALQLTIALLIIRVTVYLLRLMLGPDSWVRAWESRLALAIWLVIAFQLVGWFDAAESALDKVDLVPGRVEFSLWDVIKGIVVVTGFVVVTSLVARALERRVMKLEALAVSTRIGITKFAYFFLVGIGILVGINAAGVDITTLTVFTGAIGLGLGFGLQAIASNFVSGFVLLMDKSIKPGDVISFTGTTGTSTENFGWVQELRGRYVVVRDRDGVETLVPNQNLITNSVINWSYSDQRVRLRLPVMIAYGEDPEKALELLLEAARHHPRILREPRPVSRLMSFEDYGMRVEVRFWIADPMNGVNNVRSDVNREIWRLFKLNGVRIPVAQREIRILAESAPLQLRRSDES